MNPSACDVGQSLVVQTLSAKSSETHLKQIHTIRYDTIR